VFSRCDAYNASHEESLRPRPPLIASPSSRNSSATARKNPNHQAQARHRRLLASGPHRAHPHAGLQSRHEKGLRKKKLKDFWRPICCQRQGRAILIILRRTRVFSRIVYSRALIVKTAKAVVRPLVCVPCLSLFGERELPTLWPYGVSQGTSSSESSGPSALRKDIMDGIFRVSPVPNGASKKQFNYHRRRILPS